MAGEAYEPDKFYNGAAYIFNSLWSPDADSQEIDSRSFMIKLVSKKHRGLDAKHALETAEKLENAISEAIEIWEYMTEEGCEELRKQSQNTLRNITKRPDNEPPYVYKWVQEDLPIVADNDWDGLSNSSSSMFDAEWKECLNGGEGRCALARKADILKMMNWDHIDKKLEEFRNRNRDS